MVIRCIINSIDWHAQGVNESIDVHIHFDESTAAQIFRGMCCHMSKNLWVGTPRGLPKSIIYLTSVPLSGDEIKVLDLGLKCIPSKPSYPVTKVVQVQKTLIHNILIKEIVKVTKIRIVITTNPHLHFAVHGCLN